MKVYNCIRTVIFIALASLVAVFANELAEIEYLRYAIGALMVFYGVEEIVFFAIKERKHYQINSLYWNIFEIVIGLTLILFVEPKDMEVTYAVVCVSWATWSILRETRELIECTHELKEKLEGGNKKAFITAKTIAALNVAESLVVIAFSVTMLIEPGEHHAKIHLYILTVELATKVLFPLVNELVKYAAKGKACEVAGEAADENGLNGEDKPDGEVIKVASTDAESEVAATESSEATDDKA